MPPQVGKNMANVSGPRRTGHSGFNSGADMSYSCVGPPQRPRKQPSPLHTRRDKA